MSDERRGEIMRERRREGNMGNPAHAVSMLSVCISRAHRAIQGRHGGAGRQENGKKRRRGCQETEREGEERLSKGKGEEGVQKEAEQRRERGLMS